jgi:hypothetical protein
MLDRYSPLRHYWSASKGLRTEVCMSRLKHLKAAEEACAEIKKQPGIQIFLKHLNLKRAI